MGEKFDFSNFPEKSKFRNMQNKLIVGKFKDEVGGFPIVEFVGLRPKMYSYTKYVPDAAGLKDAHRAKGIQKSASARLTHDDFVRQLERPEENSVPCRRIGFKLHKLYTYEVEKRALCSYDDKRWLMDNGITTKAFGHKDIPVVWTDIRPERVPAVWEEDPVRADEALVPNETDAIPADAPDGFWYDFNFIIFTLNYFYCMYYF